MKILKTIFFFAAVTGILTANAQVKQQSTAKKNTSKTSKPKGGAMTVNKPSLNKPIKPASQTTATHTAQKVSKDHTQVAENKQEGPVGKSVRTVEKPGKVQSAPPYKVAVGLKFLWGIAATGKYFFKDDQAIEAIVRYRSYDRLINEFTISALYEYEKPIAEVPGLYWLVGGGPFFGTMSIKDSYIPKELQTSGNTNFGIAGIAGLEYKFEKLPIAITADWMPAVNIKGGGGFSAENGGLGIKYAF